MGKITLDWAKYDGELGMMIRDLVALNQGPYITESAVARVFQRQITAYIKGYEDGMRASGNEADRAFLAVRNDTEAWLFDITNSSEQYYIDYFNRFELRHKKYTETKLTGEVIKAREAVYKKFKDAIWYDFFVKLNSPLQVSRDLMKHHVRIYRNHPELRKLNLLMHNPVMTEEIWGNACKIHQVHK